MKKMKMMKRVAMIALCMLILACTLVACGTTEAVLDTKFEGQSAEYYFAKLLMQNESARIKFMAAANGYDMDKTGFDDSQVDLSNAQNDPMRAPDATFFVDEAGNPIVETSDDPKISAFHAVNTPYLNTQGKPYYVSVEGAKNALKMVKPADTALLDLGAYNSFLETLSPLDIVRTVEVMRAQSAISTVDESGIFDTLMTWAGKFLGILTYATGGYYVLALFFFAIVVEIVLIYFSIKQQKTSQKQARLKPKEAAIRKKYAGRNDQKAQQALQQELQAMYQQEGVSMFGGCLPLLLQMPILIALYNIVIDPLHYVLGFGSGVSTALQRFAITAKAAGGLGVEITTGRGSIEVLSAAAGKLDGFRTFAWYSNAGQVATELEGVSPPNFSLFGLDMGLTPGFTPPYLLLLIPVLTFAAYFFSMKFTRKFSYQPNMGQTDAQMGCSNNMMDIMMPLMSVYITFITPAAVGIYWIFKCLIGMLKQFLLHKAIPMPVFTEEDYKRAERELKGKARPEDRASQSNSSGKKSLHEEDDEELPERKRDDSEEEEDSIYERRKKAEEEKKAKEAARRLEGAKLKEDRKNNKKK